MKKLTQLLTVLATTSLICFVSCSNNSEGNSPSNETPQDGQTTTAQASSTLKYLNITNAKNLYISGGSGTSANKAVGINASTSGSGAKKIFKITDADHIEELKYLDANKKEITVTKQPAAIYSVNNDYIFIGFSSGYLNDTGYLVKKSDGAVFDLTNVGFPDFNHGYWKKASIFHTDKKNNMYYTSCDHSNGITKIIRVNLGGEDSLIGEIVSPSSDIVRFFDVDKDGNIIYDVGSATSNASVQFRIRKYNGELKNISRTSTDDYSSWNFKHWIGLDGCIYIADYEPNLYGSSIKKITIDAEGNVSESDYGSTRTRYNAGDLYKIYLKNRIIIVCGGTIDEVYNPSSSPRTITLAGIHIDFINDVNATENFYYIAGKEGNDNTILLKVNPEDDSWTNLLPDNNYEVYTFTASETDGITFNALRMSDGKKIIGKVGINGGAVTVIDEESDAKITYLERIN